PAQQGLDRQRRRCGRRGNGVNDSPLRGGSTPPGGCHGRRAQLVLEHDPEPKGVEMRVFVAGATGAIGRRLLPQLVASGHEVVATTRSPEKVELLRTLGAEPVVVDGLDALAVGEAVARAEPEAIVHQMTALTGMSNLRRFDREFAVTNELRTKGTDNLLAAAAAAGVRR